MSTEHEKQYARDYHRRKRARILESLADLPGRLEASAKRKTERAQRAIAG